MSFSEVAAITIHDVKNRLAQLAAHAERTGDRETLNIAIDAAGRLTELLTYYKSKSGLLRVEINPHSPTDLVEELVRESAGLTSVAIEQDPEGGPALAFFDAVLVRMVLANAIHNAARFARTRVGVGTGQADGYCVFTVRDDGEGFPEGVLADCGDSAPVSRAGTGLGLRLASRIAELHEGGGRRGRIALHNDSGAVFSLWVPL